MYVSDERTNRLYMFRYAADDRLEAEPAYTRQLLAQPSREQPRQLAGAIHVHPSGRFLYVANRADHTVSSGDRQVFAGGENNIAVFSIHPETGEPGLVQHADTHSFHVRTFACDPSGRLLVAASIKPLDHMDGGEVRTVPATLSLFHVNDGGRLDWVRHVAVDTTGGRLQYWMGLVRA
jgi:6-phosphogluconolactonase (cycloisomerase 2 family)